MQTEYGLSYVGLDHVYFDCQCSDFNHIFRFVLDQNDGDLWLEAHLSAWLPWYKRLWLAILFIFARTPAYHGHFDTTMIREQDYFRLHALLDQSAGIKKKIALKSNSEKFSV